MDCGQGKLRGFFLGGGRVSEVLGGGGGGEEVPELWVEDKCV